MTSGSVTLELDGVSKRYALGECGRLRGFWARVATGELWALRDVSLRVASGESVGLIGHNGAGKTTALRLLAGITRPTRGTVARHGRVASLINLGAGFHKELTGRENVYLNGVILGLSRREVRQRFDAIAAFAGLGDYLDTPVKRYSSGMYARLGFAVAAHVDADILLVDEVLSVGDVAFQDRCIRAMQAFQQQGCSILFVSHNLSAVEMMCQRAVWLDHGRIRASGPTAEVVGAYLRAVDQELLGERDAGGGGDVRGPLAVAEVRLLDERGRPTMELDYGDRWRVGVRCVVREPVQSPRVQVEVKGDYGPLFRADSLADGFELGPWEPGAYVVECGFNHLPLLPGPYRVEVQAAVEGASETSTAHGEAVMLVSTDLAVYGSTSVVGASKSRGGLAVVPYDWHVSLAGQPAKQRPGLMAPAHHDPPDGRRTSRG